MLKTGLHLDKIEDDIEEDREGRSKGKMDEKKPSACNALGFWNSRQLI